MAYLKKAGQKRWQEFAAVRLCAKIALQSLNYERPVMVPGRSGLPTLLNGLIGSMTHCNSYCAAAVAPSQVCNAIGIDAEPNRGVTPGVLDRIASSTKCEHVQYLRALHPHISFDRLLFSSKESIYKAVFSNSGDSLRFKDVRVLANPNSNFDTQITSSHLRRASLQVILGRARRNLGYYCYHSSHRSACQSDGSSRDIYLTRDKMENRLFAFEGVVAGAY
ncbi:4'-phosphopantetheinyl transferase family protein [Actinomyces gerencseriae]|uniref:4'-phosphopantetheinyl transferase family protein n=1 Tax=Actinomyces gerencseriae TaxID=52769 RepID=UPI003CCC1F81